MSLRCWIAPGVVIAAEARSIMETQLPHGDYLRGNEREFTSAKKCRKELPTGPSD